MTFLAIFLVLNAVNLGMCYTHMSTITRIVYNIISAIIGIATFIVALFYLPWDMVLVYYIIALIPNWAVIKYNGGVQKLFADSIAHTH